MPYLNEFERISRASEQDRILMELPPAVNPNRGMNRLRLIAIAVLISILAVFYLSGLHHELSWESMRESRDDWRQMVDENKAPAIALFLISSVCLMSMSLPVGSVLSIAAGALFDLWLGAGLITIASAIGATSAFLISRHLLRDFVRHWFGRWLRIIDPRIQRDGSRYLLMLRLSPVVPFFAVNAVMGLTKMPLRTYFFVTLFGMLPSCFLYVMVGTQMMKINSPQDIVSWQLVVLLSLLAVTPLLFGWIMRRKVVYNLNEKSELLMVENSVK